MPMIVGELFETSVYSTILGYSQTAIALGGSLLTLFATSLYDWSGGYLVTLVLAGFMGLLVILLLLAAYRLAPGSSRGSGAPHKASRAG